MMLMYVMWANQMKDIAVQMFIKENCCDSRFFLSVIYTAVYLGVLEKYLHI